MRVQGGFRSEPFALMNLSALQANGYGFVRFATPTGGGRQAG